MYIKRTLETYIKQANKQFPALFITGPRQVGKTTILKHLCSNDRKYVTLDDPMLKNLAKEEPKIFLERFGPPVLIDEIQYAPELLTHIKIFVDKNKRPGLFWLTGSQPFHLMQGVSETLAGRIGLINLLGLSQYELNQQANLAVPFLPTKTYIKLRADNFRAQTLSELYNRIWRGSFPLVAIDEHIDRNLFYSSYVQTYLQRDVRDLAKVGNEAAFLRFLKMTAARTGQLLNITDLARDVDVSPNTIKSWLSILESSHIIYFLQPYFTNLNKRLIKTAKMYFLDTGLCTYLTEWSSSATLESGAMSGSILETFAITEIIKSYWHNGQQAPLYYYRDKDQKEVDLLIFKDDAFYPVEIKKTASPSANHIKNFKLIANLGKKVGPGGLVCLIDNYLPLNAQATAIPISML